MDSINAKCELSQLSEVDINIPFIAKKDGKSINLNLILTRSKFEDLCEELFERLIRPCKIALKQAGCSPKDFNKVVLVGGATRMKKVSEIVRRIFQFEPSRSVNPEEAVALGAAIQAGVLSGEVKDVLLLDTTSHTLSIETTGGIATPLIENNTSTPTKKSQIFSTSLDGQTSVEVHILEGENPMVIDNRTLGRFILDGIMPAPKGVPQIQVTFDIDANKILHVTAEDKATGKESRLRVRASTGMSENDIDYLSHKLSSTKNEQTK